MHTHKHTHACTNFNFNVFIFKFHLKVGSQSRSLRQMMLSVPKCPKRTVGVAIAQILFAMQISTHLSFYEPFREELLQALTNELIFFPLDPRRFTQGKSNTVRFFFLFVSMPKNAPTQECDPGIQSQYSIHLQFLILLEYKNSHTETCKCLSSPKPCL